MKDKIVALISVLIFVTALFIGVHTLVKLFGPVKKARSLPELPVWTDSEWDLLATIYSRCPSCNYVATNTITFSK